MRARFTLPLAAVGAGVSALGYAGLVERNAFALRRYDVPVLPAGATPLRILHLSDVHMTRNQRRKQAWIRRLAELQPDLVVDTGDNIGRPDAVPAMLDALAPLLDVPGVFVLGSNDYYRSRPKNPLRYLFPGDHQRVLGVQNPWPDLVDAMTAAGWHDLTHRRTTIKVAGRLVEVAGVDDPHLHRDIPALVGGRVDPDAAVHLALTHSPEPRVLDAFAGWGFEVVFAGHTHGGQLRVPGYGALVTNCGLDRHRARGLSDYGGAWLHVSAGLGTSPYAPVRFACRPEASLLTLVPLDSAAALRDVAQLG
ncbi:MAG: metallophosphoesterase [Mycobacteriales bacterium]|nr:metallophosphoesterase [Frankia sp.]